MAILWMHKARSFPSGLRLPLTAAATGALAAWLIWNLQERPAAPPALALPRSVAPAAPPVSKPPPVQALAAPVERPPVPPAPPEPAPALTLLRIELASDGARAVFLERSTRRVLSAAEGEEVAGHRVMQIEADAAVVGHGQELERLRVAPP